MAYHLCGSRLGAIFFHLNLELKCLFLARKHSGKSSACNICVVTFNEHVKKNATKARKN